ncbi:MAG: GNAT family N-acetyltransferase, partial [Janthinobacterium lividum]
MDSDSDLFVGFGTSRLKLRCIGVEDATRISEMMTSSVSSWVAAWPVPFSLEMAVERISSMRQAFVEGRALPCAIQRRSDGALLGCISVTRRNAGERRAMI